MPRIPFTVDSALLRELGERLVGQPHVALAELIKNSYDADARRVEVQISSDRIEVSDNGQGMDLSEFKRYWMRIGSPHKSSQRISRRLKRPLTGQKGIGRLAAQFLGSRLELHTASDKGGPQLRAEVDWSKAIRAGDLTQAVAEYRKVRSRSEFPEGERHGTNLIIRRLHHPWSKDDVKRLAREIWNLQPPFASLSDGDSGSEFRVVLFEHRGKPLQDFDQRLQPYLKLWHARITGRILPRSERTLTGNAEVAVEFEDGDSYKHEFALQPCPLDRASFEIRVFNLQGRKKGVRLSDLRKYLKTHGGVHIYDSGFHLPYYGVNTDWLRIEMDHSHRLSRSQLLPDQLQVDRGLNYLPTNSRILGVVHVDTAHERRTATDARAKPHTSLSDGPLVISVTRDRLNDNSALTALRDAVRFGIDFYATREAKREFDRIERGRPVERLTSTLEGLDALLDQHADSIPAAVRSDLKRGVVLAVQSATQEAQSLAARSNILGALATAGITALAFDHEISKQLMLLEQISRNLRTIAEGGELKPSSLVSVADQLNDWTERVRSTRALFSSFSNEENRTRRERLRAKVVVDRVWTQMGFLRKGLSVDLDGVSGELRLPEGTFAEWTAIFQNVFVNAINATLDSDEKKMTVVSRVVGRVQTIVIQDTGVGIDLDRSEQLFEPFERALELSPERRALGLGGTGLGLTIVRMVATNLGCKVAFVEPNEGYSTAFRLSWTEKS